MKQIDILNLLIPKFKANSSISSVLLMGSVAVRAALPTSDLDLLILGEECRFQTEMIDGIMVEYHYITFDEALQNLNNNSMDLYHYIGSKIMYDLDGRMLNLMRTALIKYTNYKTDKKDKKELYHWLISTRIKLNTSVQSNDYLKVNFITAVSSWKVLEAVFAVNDKPVPPAGRVIRELPNLKTIPEEHWFEGLFHEDTNQRTKSMLSVIGWVLPLLEG
jgi:predicted nucleotidyltransferase